MATFIIQTDGSLWSCGQNNYSQTGLGGTADILTLTKVGSDKWKNISSDTLGALGIQIDGSLWCVGSNGPYLRFGLSGDKTTFTKVGTDKWKAIALGADYSLGIKEDGTLWGVGDNSQGQLGLGTTGSVSVFTQIGSDKWSMIKTGLRYTIGIKQDGTLWGWGVNDKGQLGLGKFSASEKTPQRITANLWKFISTGSDFAYGIKEDGSLWAWGNAQDWGTIGTGVTFTTVNSPQLVHSGEWISCSCGHSHALCINKDKTLYGAGKNHIGQFGNGTQTSSSILKQVSTALWSQITASLDYSVGILNNAKVRTSGYNNRGWCGTGDTSHRYWFTELSLENAETVFNYFDAIPLIQTLLLLQDMNAFYTLQPYLQKIDITTPLTPTHFIEYGFKDATYLFQYLNIQQQKFTKTNNIHSIIKPSNWSNIRVE